MLKVNVGLSRKLSRDFNSTGFSLNLEGEICVGPEDPEGMIEKIKEFYDLAEEALNQQLERYAGDSAIGSRDEVQPKTSAPSVTSAGQEGSRTTHTGSSNGKGSPPSGDSQSPNGEEATNKQVQYLLNLGKRQGLTLPKLEGRIETLLGKKVGVYNLTKKEAGEVIDALSQPAEPVANGNGRSRTSR